MALIDVIELMELKKRDTYWTLTLTSLGLRNS